MKVKINFREKIKEILESPYLMVFLIILLILRFIALGISFNFFAHNLFAEILKNELIYLINLERRELGLPPLQENKKLTEASRLKAEDMILNNYFSHTSPMGISPWYWFKKVGYQYKYAGENLAIGFYNSKDVINAWLNSSSHRENILNPKYREVGIAILKGFGPNKTTLVVQFLADQDYSIKVTENKFAQEVQKEELSQTSSSIPKESSKEPKENKISIPSSPFVLGMAKEKMGEGFYFKFLNYVLYNYEEILRNFLYFVVLIFIISLSIFIFSYPKPFNKDFVLRMIILITILSISLFLERDIIGIFLVDQALI